ncbi:vegetative cell wall protein gp1-like [Pseudomyrmex gracilis]|uniref:vegetative cell wall protein gp1-like n=1 Tax=Pseudomyrmex gracilis TaxID=219809 RepID=UPI000995B978|nr:vegetative cell wall protein gp1-like [Pseudomyrmex gracilis]
MRVAVILLACVVALCSAQFPDGHRPIPIPIRSARYQKLPAPPRPSPGSPAVFPNQPNQPNRLRRPIAFRPRGPGDDAPGTFRPVRPNLPVAAPPPFVHQVKPVNEDTEEDDIPREHGDIEDSRDQSQEPNSEEEVSEEVPRTSPSPVSRISSAAPGPIVYRPPQAVTPTSVRGSPATPPPPPPPPPIQYRPTQKPTKAPRKQIVDDIAYRQPIKAPPPKPLKPSQDYEIRGKKPVAQIIRRYRHDNDDGSITWGFENDDGSYKEETIGVDCITSGKYGYIDPDGIRREYTYETGIKCDEEQREEDEENGFVDYQENKLVLPDGKTIDLSSMGKKQARRPQFQYRN